MNEIKIQPQQSSPVQINGKTLSNFPKKLGKITKISWDEALSKRVFSSTTLKHLNNIFIQKLGITPTNVYIERTDKIDTPSVYIKANYHGEDLLYVRKATSSATGVTKLYSKYANVNITDIDTNYKSASKDEILRYLKIPVDLAEIMILPNNKATMDKFEMNETETAPVTAPPKPTTKPNNPPKREKLGNPQVQPRPKASLKEDDKEVVNKIIQRFQNLKHESN